MGPRHARWPRRYLGSTSAVTADAVIFDQQELRRNVGLYSDLYLLDRRFGRRPRSHARGEAARSGSVARSADDRRRCARAAASVTSCSSRLTTISDVGRVTTLVADADTQFATPRWSPDGRSIAVERHRLGGGSEVVVVDAATRAVRVVATGATRAVTPAWRPDGRAIVAAVDNEDQAFTLWEFLLEGDLTRRPLTAREALWPDVSADGSTIVFVGYTDQGFDLFTMPYPPAPAATDASVATRPPLAPALRSIGARRLARAVCRRSATICPGLTGRGPRSRRRRGTRCIYPTPTSSALAWRRADSTSSATTPTRPRRRGGSVDRMPSACRPGASRTGKCPTPTIAGVRVSSSRSRSRPRSSDPRSSDDSRPATLRDDRDGGGRGAAVQQSARWRISCWRRC